MIVSELEFRWDGYLRTAGGTEVARMVAQPGDVAIIEVGGRAFTAVRAEPRRSRQVVVLDEADAEVARWLPRRLRRAGTIEHGERTWSATVRPGGLRWTLREDGRDTAGVRIVLRSKEERAIVTGVQLTDRAALLAVLLTLRAAIIAMTIGSQQTAGGGW